MEPESSAERQHLDETHPEQPEQAQQDTNETLQVKQPTQPAAESPAEPTKSTESVQAPADKDAADKAAADKATADKVTADKATADKAVADKAAVDKTAADKAADDDKAADKTARRAIPRGRQLTEPPETVPDPTGTNAKLAKNKGSSSVRTAAAREPTSLSTVDAAPSDLFHPESMIPTSLMPTRPSWGTSRTMSSRSDILMAVSPFATSSPSTLSRQVSCL
jgi:hypothetical protein